MDKKTLIKVSASEHCISFRTVSRERKSDQRFLMTRSELARLEHEQRIIIQDIRSFAILRRDITAGTLSIEFSWLHGGCGSALTGWEETVVLPYDALMDFVEASARKDGPEKWKTLSLQAAMTPQIVFVDTEKLRKCLENRTVRGKLARALRDNFLGAERVEFYHDFEAYSFMFQSYRAGRSSVTGGLIFHNDQDDLKKGHYSVHT